MPNWHFVNESVMANVVAMQASYEESVIALVVVVGVGMQILIVIW